LNRGTGVADLDPAGIVGLSTRRRAIALWSGSRVAAASTGRRNSWVAAQRVSQIGRVAVSQVARHQGRRLFAFTRPGDLAAQNFARSLGAEWAGGSDEAPPEPIDAALIFAPVGALVPAALAATKKGGTVVSGGIHMSDIPSFPYRILWEERAVRSVANLTRRDAEEFLALAPEAGIRTETVTYPLARANDALADLRNGALQGAAVLIP
jgi:alcohol dehydrogenase, propanol-preferring